MTDRNLFEAIITSPNKGTTLIIESLNIIRKYGNINLRANDKGEVFYEIKINDLLKNNITEEDIALLRDGSWKIENDFLVKFL